MAAPAAVAGKKKDQASTGSDWSEVEKYRKKLAGRIIGKFKTWSTAEVDKFIKEDENRTYLAAWDLISACEEDGEDDFKTFKRIAKKSDFRRFLADFVNDPDWAEGYLHTAPTKNAVFFVQLLKAFADKDPEVKSELVIKKMATATAGEFSRRGWFEDEFETDRETALKNGPTRIYRRFKFFTTSWRKKRLNVIVDNLDFWDMRIICGVTGRTNDIFYGHEASLRWGQDNVKLPEAGYASGRDIHQMPYRLWNKVGDSVHSRDYYWPFRDYYDRNQLKTALEVGCVCGGVSHFGASAACANGVPGVTMGEPGHCAFAVRVGNKWRDNNSISWKRGVHWRLWEEENAWAFLHLTQALYEDTKNTPVSFRIANLARVAASNKKVKPETVISLYEYALKKQPLNFPVWREFLQYAEKHAKTDKVLWEKAHKMVVEGCAPEFPNVAATILGKFLYPNLLPLLESPADRVALYAKLWEQIEDHGPGRWDYESVWNYQVQTLTTSAGVEAFKAYGKPEVEYKADKETKSVAKPGNDPAQQQFKEKIGAILASRKSYAKDFENWKNGVARSE